MLRILFPIVTGRVVDGLIAGLDEQGEAYGFTGAFPSGGGLYPGETVLPSTGLAPDGDGVGVGRKLPPKPHRTRRMVTVRDDSGPQSGVVQRRGFGFNVWAETSVNSEKLALMCMAILPTLSDGAPIVRVSNLSGPFEITDEKSELVVVDGVTLTHFYFSAQITVRGTDL